MEEKNQNQQNITNTTNENISQMVNAEQNKQNQMDTNLPEQNSQNNTNINMNQIESNPNNQTIPVIMSIVGQNKINPEIEGEQPVNPNQIEEMNNINIRNNTIMPEISNNAQFNEHYYEMQNEYYGNPLIQGQIIMEQPQNQNQTESQKNKNIFDYYSDKNLFGIAFQNGNCPRLAISSMEKSLHNKIEILDFIENDLKMVYQQKMEYPCTKLIWSPKVSEPSILAVSDECIQLYNYDEQDKTLKFKTKLANKKSKYCGALTSFDWNTVNNSLLGTASIDTTCTIWDLNKCSIKTQLIAHDKEVFDIQFDRDENTFISGGADGSVRLFDLRNLNHSTIIYETKGCTPINKLAWNLQNKNLIAALSMDKNVIYLFDSRANSNISMDEINLHKEPVTGIVWAPDNQSQLCSVSEDSTVVISNVQNEFYEQNNNVSYNAPSLINNVDWCRNFPEWIGITFKKRVQLLRK